MGRANAVLPEAASCSSDVRSETMCSARRAKARGRGDLAAEEVAETTRISGVQSENSFSRRDERVSAYYWDVE